MGRILAICVEKMSELPNGHKDRKFKGRIVFMGNEVRDEYHEYAIFQDLSSSPAALEAAKALDAFGSFKGHVRMQAGAKQAYVQAYSIQSCRLGFVCHPNTGQIIGMVNTLTQSYHSLRLSTDTPMPGEYGRNTSMNVLPDSVIR